MASFASNGTGTQTENSLFQDKATSSASGHAEATNEDAPSPKEARTAAHIDRREKGDEKAKDLGALPDPLTGESQDQQAAALRRKLAESLCEIVARMIASQGSVRLASHLQILRRELSQCHELLVPFKSETDFLSLVVLVEMELGNKDWKAITKPELQTLKDMLQIGVREPRVTFDHYNQAARSLVASGWISGPTFEIDVTEAERNEQSQ
jgi:hypothetical protein